MAPAPDDPADADAAGGGDDDGSGDRSQQAPDEQGASLARFARGRSTRRIVNGFEYGADDRANDSAVGSVSTSGFGAEPSTSSRFGRPSLATLVMATLGLALVGLFSYDLLFVRVYLVETWEWDPTRSDWLFLASLWLLITLATRLVPNRALAARYWGRLRVHRDAVASLVALGVFFLVGVVGPLAIGEPQSRFLLGGQPPVFLSVDANSVADCAGAVRGDRCFGSLRFPLGTDTFGYSVLTLLVSGARLAVYVAVITAAIVVPVGAAVGAVAGFYGGRVDAVLNRYIDVQQTIPAVVAYVVLVLVIEKSLFMLVLVFGLFSWGGVARVVRAETKQRRSAEYVRAAEGLGGTRLYRLRRHVLPNVSHGVVTAFGQQVPLLLLTEAAIAYLGLNDIDQPSWGTLIANGVDSGVVDQWWVAGAGVVALAGTTLAFKLIADALRDALDPTG
ncbi:ABC transporter permease [Halobaculum limi]|uniref:ABC transporter permease n=1 Tax=Halobaculum limi TaxID=3031916 RepID=UPI0024073FB4|nr:ABC transporter permease [Halobaculum sp. YSMS11]